jgi:hypothetical protein
VTVQVDPTTGEVTGTGCAECRVLKDRLAGAQRDIAAWQIRYANLERSTETDVRGHPRYEEVKQLFNYWRQECNHPRSKFTKDRFEIALPFLEKYGEDNCKRAIDGLAYDPFITTRKNGTTKRHDAWDLAFRSADKFEEYANRAPLARVEEA